MNVNQITGYGVSKINFSSRKKLDKKRNSNISDEMYQNNSARHKVPSGKLAVALAALVGLSVGGTYARNAVRPANDFTFSETSLVENVDTTGLLTEMEEGAYPVRKPSETKVERESEVTTEVQTSIEEATEETTTEETTTEETTTEETTTEETTTEETTTEATMEVATEETVQLAAKETTTEESTARETTTEAPATTQAPPTTKEITTQVPATTKETTTQVPATTKETTTQAPATTQPQKLTPRQKLQKQYGITIDGVIDKHNVSRRGDCYLLATLETLNATKSGRKFLNNCVTVNDDSVSVYFPGINYTSKIPFSKLKETKGTKGYSKGDDDTLLFELAIEDAFKKIKSGQVSAANEIVRSINDSKDVLYAGYMQDVMYLLTGKLSWETLNPCYDFHDAHFDDRYDYDLNAAFDSKMNNHDHVAMAVCLQSVYTPGAYHSFGVIKVDENSVTVMDPVGSKVITYSRDELAKIIVDIEHCKF